MNQVSILLIILIFSGFILVLDSTLFPKVFANDGKNITEVNSLEHQEVFATGNSLVLLENSYPNNDIYILAYSDGDTDGFIKTFNISSDGSTITEIAVLEHDIDLAGDNSLVQVDSDTYALAYEGTSNQRGYISTFNISSDGTITAVKTQSLGNNLQHDTRGFENSLVQVDSDTYALAYSGENDDGYISTFTISLDGSTITEITSITHDEGGGTTNSLVQVDSDTYALAYGGSGFDGYISTFTIPADGSTITKVASIEHDELYGVHNSLVQVDSDTYALAYAGDGNDGYISTFTIPVDGSTITKVASIEHDTTNGMYNSLVQVDSDTYALAYSGESSDGYISTFTISSNSSSSSSSGGGKNNCDSNGFGKSNSLRVYQVTYNVNTFEVQVQAYSTCGSISTKMTTPSGQSILGLSTEQPLLNDRIVVYSGFLDESDEKFNISIQNKRDSFSETFYIYDKSIAKKYTGDTGYTSEQQGASLPTVTSEQTTVVSEPPVTQIVQTIQDPITVDSQKQIPDEKSDALQVQSIVYTPEPVAEKETKPQCGAGTKLVDGICKIIKPDEPKFCFLFWCW